MADDDSVFKKMISDWHVLVMIALVIFAIASIYILPPNFGNGAEGNLQLGLDLEGGAWIQLSYDAEVVRFTSTTPLDQFVTDLSTTIDAPVEVISEDRLEIQKLIPEDELAEIFAGLGAKLVSYEQGVSEDTADVVKRILEEKVNTLGTRDARFNTITSSSGVSRYMRVELAGADINTAQDIVGSQGKFEIRIATTGNESDHVLYGDAVTSVSKPTQYPPGSDSWGVGFTLSPEGAQAFKDGAIQYGATTNPEAHELMMFLDGNMVYTAPLSTDLASKLRTGTVRELSASTGAGTDGMEKARELEIHLRAGALPVDVEIAGSGQVSASLGEYFKMMCVLAGLLALAGVAVMVYYRYREPLVVIPMICTNIAEIVILLGIARYIQQLDLASIAGLIAVLGTGIDQLVVITDEVLHEGKVPSPSIYQSRLKRAFGIIMISAATMVIAMLPLAVMDLASLKGFAIITILGVLIGVTITRPAYGKIIMAILSRKDA